MPAEQAIAAIAGVGARADEATARFRVADPQRALAYFSDQGQWEDTTGSLASTRQFAALPASKGIRHELDLWGHDVPHDWPSWRAQLAHHLPRFC